MISVILFCSLLAFAAGNPGFEDECPNKGFVDQRCPLQIRINGQVTCFKAEGEGYTGYTHAKAEEICKEHGPGAHLANVYDKAVFAQLRCLIINKDTARPIRDKKVLTGMSYNKQNDETTLSDGKVLQTPYNGEDPLDYLRGARVVFKADGKKFSESMLIHHGTENGYRYKRFLCEYPWIK